MPYQLVLDGVVREFEFYPPNGWPCWVERAHAKDGREGPPLVIAMHGGGQTPANFAIDWPFPLLFNSADNANWEDRCFVFYPYGFAYMPKADGEPRRGWNVGFTGTYLATQNDVAFIRAMLDAVETMLQKEFRAVGSPRRTIDRHRRFLFGYSMGGMMAYRLASACRTHGARCGSWPAPSAAARITASRPPSRSRRAAAPACRCSPITASSTAPCRPA